VVDQDLEEQEVPMVVQELEAAMEDQDLVVTLDCRVMVDSGVETAWEDLVWEILMMTPGEEKN